MEMKRKNVVELHKKLTVSVPYSSDICSFELQKKIKKIDENSEHSCSDLCSSRVAFSEEQPIAQVHQAKEHQEFFLAIAQTTEIVGGSIFSSGGLTGKVNQHSTYTAVFPGCKKSVQRREKVWAEAAGLVVEVEEEEEEEEEEGQGK
ncbi:hypothetical protein LguiA_029531 [Lonicera macranthoides]